MRLRVASVKNEQFETCLLYKVWGSNKSNIRDWKIDDYLVFKVGNEYKALVQITGELYEDDLLIWDNGFYPYRLPFKIIKMSSDKKKVLHEGAIKNSFLEKYGIKYGWTILNKVVLDIEVANQIMEAFMADKQEE